MVVGDGRNRGLFSRACLLDSIYRLQVFRGMLDMSLRWWRESPLLGTAPALLFGTAL
jgi:hypothetical protein